MAVKRYILVKTYVVAFAIALFTSWVLTPYVKNLAFKIGAVDKPDPRKVHKGIMPRLGGLPFPAVSTRLSCCTFSLTCTQPIHFPR